MQGDFGRVQPIKNIGTLDFKANLENNLVMVGETCQIISKDEEVILNVQVGDEKHHRIMYLKHVGDQVHLMHSQAYVKLRQLKIQIGKWKLAIQINLNLLTDQYMIKNACLKSY